MPKSGLSQWGLLKFMMDWAIPASDSCRTPFMCRDHTHPFKEVMYIPAP